MKCTCKLIAVVAACFLFLATTASATEYEYTHIGAPLDNCNDLGYARAGTITKIFTSYDSVTNEFVWTATHAPCEGRIPNGYWNVINNGPNPKGHSGELAIFYFDATDKDNIIVSFYAYNGRNPLSYSNGVHGGVSAPDRIATNKGINAPWLLEANVIDNNISGERTFHLKIDANILKAHTPAYPDNVDPWYGIGFDNNLGFWYHAMYELSTSYCENGDTDDACGLVAPGQTSDGYLKSWSYSKQSYSDKGGLTTNTVPYCIGKYKKTTANGVPLSDDLVDLDDLPTDAGGCHQLTIGESFYAEITGKDADQDTLQVTYSGQPQNAVITPNTGSILPSPVTVTFDWTPTILNEGSMHDVMFNFLDEQDASTSCRMKFCVPQDLDPVCDIKITTDNLSCGGPITAVDFDASSSTDPEGGALTYQWFTTCENSSGQLETLDVSNDTNARLILTQPGQGQDVNCTVGLIVTDKYNQSVSCDVPVSVDGCDLDCLGNPNGDAKYDECGVCNGTNACLDCLDIPNGDAKYDLCGVCNGTNDCLDCAGNPNGDSEFDQCNVCDGDGTSCLDCQDIDITQLQFQLDGIGIEQYHTLRYATKLLRRKGTNRAVNRTYIENVLAEGTELKNANWVLTWSMPHIVTQCANTQLCVEISNETTVTNYNNNAEELFKMTRRVLRRMRRQIEERKNNGRRNRFAIKYNRRARAQRDEAFELSATVPKTASSCF